MEREVIVISGPTASGKTEFSIHVAKKLATEIISADSRQFYKYLNIGTAKPSENQLNSVPHHLFNFLYPNQEYNISLFRENALSICNTIWAKGKIPIIVGGSGLYIKAIIDGLADTPDPDPRLRSELLKKKEIEGAEALYSKLIEVDPITASSMIPQNWKRVIRALEVFYITGKPISEFYATQKDNLQFRAFQFLLDWDRKVLYERINNRVDIMIENGLADEVKHILENGYTKEMNALKSVGYKEMIAYLEGRMTLEQSIDLIKTNSRRYAKRQLTWFRKDSRIERISIKSNEELYIFAENIAERFIHR